MDCEVEDLTGLVRSLQKRYSAIFDSAEQEHLLKVLSAWLRDVMTTTVIDVDVSSYLATCVILMHVFKNMALQDRNFLEHHGLVVEDDLLENLTFEMLWEWLHGLADIPRPPFLVRDAMKRMWNEFNDMILNGKTSWNFPDPSSLLKHDVLGLLVQKTLRQRMRKRLAAHFTNHQVISSLLDVNNLLGQFLSEKLKKGLASDSPVVKNGSIELNVMDPFAGSGRLLVALGVNSSLKSFLNEMRWKRMKIRFHAIELYPLSAMACVLNLMLLRSHLCRTASSSQDLMIDIVVKQGDTFQFFQNADLKNGQHQPQLESSSLLSFFSSQNTSNDNRQKLIPSLFSLHSHDIVLMNPPYTRYRMLEKSYRKVIKRMFRQEEKLFDSHAGLHVFSLLLGEKLLRNDGLLLAVLPASMLHARYAWTMKQLWIQQQRLRLVVAFSMNKAFSDDSEFREITLVIQKGQPLTHVIFALLDSSSFRLTRRNIISTNDLQEHWNWLTFFHDSRFQHSFRKLSRCSMIVSASNLEDFRLIRGFEMYGPEFFFLPNNYWNVVSESSDALLITRRELKDGKALSSRNDDTNQREICLPKEVLGRALRKPSLYRDVITPEVSHWVFMPSLKHLSIEEVKRYIEWGKTMRIPAIAKFGPTWPVHVHDQVTIKKPIGRVFIPDKISLTTHATMVHYVDENVLASKNFYLFSRNEPSRPSGYDVNGDENDEINAEKLLAAWMSSSLFVFLNLMQRREIGGSLGRLQIVDYLNNPLLLDVSSIQHSRHVDRRFLDDWLEVTLEIFDEFRSRTLPPFRQQLDDTHRIELDDQFVKLLKHLGEVTIQGEEIREYLSQMIMEFESRDA